MGYGKRSKRQRKPQKFLPIWENGLVKIAEWGDLMEFFDKLFGNDASFLGFMEFTGRLEDEQEPDEVEDNHIERIQNTVSHHTILRYSRTVQCDIMQMNSTIN